MDVVQVLEGLGGVARRHQLTAAGVGGSQITAALSAGRMSRPERGVFAVPGADPSLLAARCARAELACVSAAQWHGLWVLRKPVLVHVAVDHGRQLPAGLLVHRARRPLTLIDICLQTLRCLPDLDALCIVECAVVQHGVRLEELRGRLSGRRDGRARATIGRINPHSQSIVETVARFHITKAGLSVQTQVYIAGVGRLDLFVEGELGVEVDGREYHSGAGDFAEDRRRWNLLTVAGVRVLRVTYAMVVHRPELFLTLVRQALAGIPARWLRRTHPSTSSAPPEGVRSPVTFSRAVLLPTDGPFRVAMSGYAHGSGSTSGQA